MAFADIDFDKLKPSARRLYFVHGYGNFLMLWGGFEILLEILIMRQMGLKPRQASIICGPLAAGPKKNMLIALLKRRPRKNKVGIGLINAAWSIASRNDFAHGFWRENRPAAEYWLINRDYRDSYRPRHKHYTVKTFLQQTMGFEKRFREIQDHFSVSRDDLDAYTTPILNLASTLEAREQRRRARRSNSEKATPKPRARRAAG